MFRKFLLLLLKMTDKPKNIDENMTDKEVDFGMKRPGILISRNGNTNPSAAPPQAPLHVDFSGNLTFKALRDIVDIYHNSPVIHSLNHLDAMMEHNTKLNNIELELMDLVFEKYNTTYKSPLAKALSENKNVKS